MHIRRLFRYALVPAFAVGLAVTSTTAAHADEEGETPSKKVRIRIARPKPLEPEAGAHKRSIHVKKALSGKSPAQAIMRWAMKEVGAADGKGHGADSAKMLKQWFEGGADVPMSGLRDELKSDGWNAEKLIKWMHGHGHQMMAMMPMVMEMLGSEGGASLLHGMNPMGGSTQTWRMHGPLGGSGHGMGSAQGGCPQCGQSDCGKPDWGPGRWGQGRRGQGMNRRGMRRWGMRGPRMGRGMGWGHNRAGRGMSHGGMFRGGMPHGSMGHGPHHMQNTRTIILWNDGSGWQRQELPSGPHGARGHGRGHDMPSWMGRMLQGGGMHGNRGPSRSGPMGHFGHQGGPGMHGGMNPMEMFGGMKGPGSEMSPAQMQKMLDAIKKHMHELEGSKAGKRLAPKLSDAEQALKAAEEALKALGTGKPGHGMKFEQLEELIKGFGGKMPKGARVRIVKPKAGGGKLEIVDEVIEEEIIEDVRKSK